MQLTSTALRTNKNIISDILNLVCPECGGRMGGQRMEFKCQGQCERDWRQFWERSFFPQEDFWLENKMRNFQTGKTARVEVPTLNLRESGRPPK